MRAKESVAGKEKCIFDEARWGLIQQTTKQHFIFFKGLGRKHENLPKKILQKSEKISFVLNDKGAVYANFEEEK